MSQLQETTLTEAQAVQDAMQTLTQQWYNALVTGLSLSPNNFQLYQGTQPVGTTSEWLWKILDAIPPKSINNSYDPTQSNNFSQNYQAVIANLKPITDNSFQACMGDYYSNWLNYIQSDKCPSNIFDSPDAMTAAFKKWAFIYAPSQMDCSASLIQSFYNDVVTIANNMFASAQKAGKGYAYNTTIADLNSAIQSAPAKSFGMSSDTESRDVSHTWAEGSTSVLFDIFSFGGGASYDSLSEQATSAGVSIDAKFQHVLTLPGAPLAKTSTDPILGQYTPWYNSAAFSRAFGTQDNTVWKNGVPSWATTFGPNGNMQRAATALVIVDGIDITMTSNTSYSSSDQEVIRARASAGFWPFFSANGSGGSETSVSFSDSGAMTVHITSPAGNPQLLGVLVSNMKDILG
ncbi:hypothetical protein [Chryseobacterium sp. JUb7]|uniref:hypothetical protein n=1 Tax=Chryseobacterium sp. JUb7 TaxID=2940599 RepID=UPI00216AAF08|nr:hypothetical protein [Chryseobacterium sp. JUb7]MCS3532942.1 hypothetical protein [Chryseobacterium sp. JUb7]